jgi:hypothetical protein
MMMPNCHNGAHSPDGNCPARHWPTNCQMKENLLTRSTSG